MLYGFEVIILSRSSLRGQLRLARPPARLKSRNEAGSRAPAGNDEPRGPYRTPCRQNGRAVMRCQVEIGPVELWLAPVDPIDPNLGIILVT